MIFAFFSDLYVFILLRLCHIIRIFNILLDREYASLYCVQFGGEIAWDFKMEFDVVTD